MTRVLLYISLVAAVPALFFAFVASGGSGNEVWQELVRWTIPGLPDPVTWVIEAVAALVVVVVGQRALALVLASSRAAALCKQYRSGDGVAARDAFRKLASMKGQHALYLVARWGLADDDIAIRELANVRLLEAELNALVPLCKALDDQEFEARSDAYELLGGMGHAAVPYLRAACSGAERDRTARNSACAALTPASDGAVDGSV